MKFNAFTIVIGFAFLWLTTGIVFAIQGLLVMLVLKVEQLLAVGRRERARRLHARLSEERLKDPVRFFRGISS